MTFQELTNKLQNLERDLSNLSLESGKNKEMINSSTREIERLISDIKTLNERSTERNRIILSLLDGRVITGTTHATAGTETTHPHYLPNKPSFVFITEKSNGIVYLSKDYDNTNIYVKGSANSLNFEAFCII